MVHFVMFSAVWRSVSHVAGDQADERLSFLHDPTLRDAVSVDAEEAHAAIRPQVPADGRLDAGLDETDDEVTSKCLALGSKEGQVGLHGNPARQRIAEFGLAKFEDSSEKGAELQVRSTWRPLAGVLLKTRDELSPGPAVVA